jgi:hypothetical protein
LRFLIALYIYITVGVIRYVIILRCSRHILRPRVVIKISFAEIKFIPDTFMFFAQILQHFSRWKSAKPSRYPFSLLPRKHINLRTANPAVDCGVT